MNIEEDNCNRIMIKKENDNKMDVCNDVNECYNYRV
jgi:hypothetical protein